LSVIYRALKTIESADGVEETTAGSGGHGKPGRFKFWVPVIAGLVVASVVGLWYGPLTPTGVETAGTSSKHEPAPVGIGYGEDGGKDPSTDVRSQEKPQEVAGNSTVQDTSSGGGTDNRNDEESAAAMVTGSTDTDDQEAPVETGADAGNGKPAGDADQAPGAVASKETDPGVEARKQVENSEMVAEEAVPVDSAGQTATAKVRPEVQETMPGPDVAAVTPVESVERGSAIEPENAEPSPAPRETKASRANDVRAKPVNTEKPAVADAQRQPKHFVFNPSPDEPVDVPGGFGLDPGTYRSDGGDEQVAARPSGAVDAGAGADAGESSPATGEQLGEADETEPGRNQVADIADVQPVEVQLQLLQSATEIQPQATQALQPEDAPEEAALVEPREEPVQVVSLMGGMYNVEANVVSGQPAETAAAAPTEVETHTLQADRPDDEPPERVEEQQQIESVEARQVAETADTTTVTASQNQDYVLTRPADRKPDAAVDTAGAASWSRNVARNESGDSGDAGQGGDATSRATRSSTEEIQKPAGTADASVEATQVEPSGAVTDGGGNAASIQTSQAAEQAEPREAEQPGETSTETLQVAAAESEGASAGSSSEPQQSILSAQTEAVQQGASDESEKIGETVAGSRQVAGAASSGESITDTLEAEGPAGAGAVDLSGLDEPSTTRVVAGINTVSTIAGRMQRIQLLRSELKAALGEDDKQQVAAILQKMQDLLGPSSLYLLKARASAELSLGGSSGYAKSLLQEVLLRDPGDKEARVNLARAEIDLGEIDAAKTRLKTLDNEYPEDRRIGELLQSIQ
jgi:hypothetical protein